jgi:hypothetical protein
MTDHKDGYKEDHTHQPSAGHHTAPRPGAVAGINPGLTQGITLGDVLASARNELRRAQPPAYIEAQLLASLPAVTSSPALAPVLAPVLAPDLSPVLSPVVRPTPARGKRLSDFLSNLSPWQWLGAGTGGAGAAFAAFMAWALLTPMSPVLPTLPNTSTSSAAVSAANLGEFVSLASAEDMARAREQANWVMPAELSQAQLAAFGMPFNPAHAADTLRAELLVADSGDVLGVRFVN